MCVIVLVHVHTWHCVYYVLYNICTRTHVTAAIVHGQGTYAYIDVHSWPHDSNLTINVLLDILTKQDFLPPVLYLQLDNTARENKNQYTLSFLSYLVQMRIFSEVPILTFSLHIMWYLYHIHVIITDPSQLPHGWSYTRGCRSSFQSYLHLPSTELCLHSLR